MADYQSGPGGYGRFGTGIQAPDHEGNAPEYGAQPPENTYKTPNYAAQPAYDPAGFDPGAYDFEAAAQSSYSPQPDPYQPDPYRSDPNQPATHFGAAPQAAPQQPTHAGPQITAYHPAHGGDAPGCGAEYGPDYGYADRAAQATAEAYAAEITGETTDAALAVGRFGKLVNGAAALVSLALILGLGVWGYKLLVRDISGVPVIVALEGPARSTPDNPGGEFAAHQGLAVNDIPGEGEAAPPPDRLVLAPASTDLTAEDAPAGALGTDLVMASAAPAAPAAPAATIEDIPEDALATDVAVAAALMEAEVSAAPADPAAAALALAESIAAGVAPLSGAATEGAEAAQSAGLHPDTIPASVPGLKTSPRPLARPENLAAAIDASQIGSIQTVAAQSAPLASGIEIDPASLEKGTRLAQLGAYESPEVARAEWDRIAVKFEDVMVGKKRVIEKAKSGGRTFYRLRVYGFEDLSDTRRFCAPLVAQKAQCIPAEVR